MRLLVLKINKRQSSYATCIYTLLEDIARTQGCDIHYAESFNADYSLTENSIDFLSIDAASFFHKLIAQQRLAAFIKKNNNSLLVQQAVSFFKQKKNTAAYYCR